MESTAATFSKAAFRLRIQAKMDIAARLRSTRSNPTPSDFTTVLAMFGSGAKTGSARTTIFSGQTLRQIQRGLPSATGASSAEDRIYVTTRTATVIASRPASETLQTHPEAMLALDARETRSRIVLDFCFRTNSPATDSASDRDLRTQRTRPVRHRLLNRFP